MTNIEPDRPTGPLREEVAAAGKPPTHRAPPTRILTEDEAPATAPVSPADPFPALAVGTLVGDRYKVTQVLQTGPTHQTYDAEDLAGYVRCWACGSTDNLAGEVYCTDCGAQLTGRHYRLYETPDTAPLPRLPEALVQSKVPGVAQVLDTVLDSKTGRHYLVLEEVSGRPLSGWTSGKPTDGATGAESPSQERALAWLVQAADLLADLHKAGAIGCDFGPDSLYVLPDDRLMLMDPASCTVAEGPTAAKAEALRTDVQRVAAGLEQWYHALPGVSTQTAEDVPTAALSAPAPAPARRPGEPPPAVTVDTVLAHGRSGEYPTAAALAEALHDVHDADTPPKDMQLTSGRASDVGVQRQLNEDSVLVLEVAGMEAAGTLPAGVYIVADGMGGYEGGEVASSIAIRTIGGMLQQQVLSHLVTGEENVPDRDEAIQLVREAILEANRRIAQLNSQRRSEMGTTTTMALIVGNHATIANVGDSRTYLWRDGKLKPITQDHSLVARLIAAGQLTPEEGRHFDRRNEIYRALGDAHLTADQIDVFERRLGPFDALLLCSDGLWELVRDEDMERIMLAAPDLNTACQQLVAAANKAGGDDNISVVIVQAVTGQED